MRGLHLLVAAAIVLGLASCVADHDDSSVVAPRTQSQDATSSGMLPAGTQLVLASPEGVDLMKSNGALTRIARGPVAAAYGIQHNLVAFQGADRPADGYPPSPEGPVMVWSDGSARQLPHSPGASSVQLLDAGTVDGHHVALVAERFNEWQPEQAMEALVLVDLEDLASRTVVAGQPAWESGHAGAYLRPDGDIVGLYHQGVEVHLVRWSSRGKRLWAVKVAEDRVVSLVASEASVAVVQSSFDKRRGFAPVLTLTRYEPTTGEPRDPTVVEVVDREGVIDAGILCREWLTASELACARSGGTPLAVSVAGSFYELGGPTGAIPTVVEGP